MLKSIRRLKAPFEIEVEVKLENDSGAAGLVFCSDDKERITDFIQPMDRSDLLGLTGQVFTVGIF